MKQTTKYVALDVHQSTSVASGMGRDIVCRSLSCVAGWTDRMWASRAQWHSERSPSRVHGRHHHDEPVVIAPSTPSANHCTLRSI